MVSRGGVVLSRREPPGLVRHEVVHEDLAFDYLHLAPRAFVNGEPVRALDN
jgi:hypothetical protein